MKIVIDTKAIGRGVRDAGGMVAAVADITAEKIAESTRDRRSVVKQRMEERRAKKEERRRERDRERADELKLTAQKLVEALRGMDIEDLFKIDE